MLLFVFTEAMLFAGMISAHAIAKSGAQQWPPAGQPRLPLQSTLLNTIALLYSGVALIVAAWVGVIGAWGWQNALFVLGCLALAGCDPTSPIGSTAPTGRS